MLGSSQSNEPVDAIVDIDVVECLVAVAVDDRPLVPLDPVEIAHDHRRVAAFGELTGAVDEEEARDPPAQTMRALRDAKEMLACELGDAVDRRGSRYVRLGHRRWPERAVCVQRGGEDNLLDTRCPGCVEEPRRRGDVDRQLRSPVTPGVLCFSAARCTSRSAPSHASRSSAGDIASSALSIRSRSVSSRSQSPLRSSSNPGRSILAHETFDEMTPDEPSCPGDQRRPGRVVPVRGPAHRRNVLV